MNAVGLKCEKLDRIKRAVISAEEIAANYEIDKARFGIP